MNHPFFQFHPSKFGFIFLIFIFSLPFSFPSLAQFGPNLGQTDRWMKSAQVSMERQEYETVNLIFRDLIDSGLPLPEAMLYFFAETLYELKQYDNSINFLNKYLELNGFAGDYYQGARELQIKLEGPLNDIKTCQLCDRRGYEYKVCFTCEGARQVEQDCGYCKARGVVGCSKCSGSGMTTRINIFKIVEYFECERCDGKGRLTCPVCEGKLKEISSCRTCGGSGRLTSENLCDHQQEPHIH